VFMFVFIINPVYENPLDGIPPELISTPSVQSVQATKIKGEERGCFSSPLLSGSNVNVKCQLIKSVTPLRTIKSPPLFKQTYRSIPSPLLDLRLLAKQ